MQVYTGHTGKITSLKIHQYASHILSGSDDGTAKLWDLDSGTQILSMIHT